MLIYQSKLRTSTVIVRLFLAFLAVVLFLTGLLGAIGMMVDVKEPPPTSAVVFVAMTITVSILIFKISAWNIRQYRIFEDRLEVRILWGLKTISRPRATLVAFNDLKVLVLNGREGGIGLVTTDNKMTKILELEVDEFPVFIENLQRIVRWDLNLKFSKVGGYTL